MIHTFKKPPRYLTIHHTATPSSYDVTKDIIDEWHRKRGFKYFGYHVLIRRDGTIEYGRKFNEIPAAVKSYNHKAMAIAVAGGVDSSGNAEDNFIDTQFRSLRSVISAIQWIYPKIVLVGHRELMGTDTECPAIPMNTLRAVCNMPLPPDERSLKDKQ